MRRKRLSAFAATILSVAAFAAFNPPQYTNTYTSGGVKYAQFGGVKSSNYVATAVSFGVASNYVDAVASEFEDGTRMVSRAISAGDASSALSSYYLAGDSWSKQYNADDLIRASTNAALSVSGTLEWRLANGYLKVASAESADTATSADTAQNAANVAWDANGNYMSGSEIYARVIEDMPRPGNYSAVSNAAMNARNITDFGVRGAPIGVGTWFLVNGHIADYHDGAWFGEDIGADWIARDDDNQYTAYFSNGSFGFSLSSDFTAEFSYDDATYAVVGYTNMLAQVSQIPVVPSGIVTTNDNGELFMYGTNVVPLVFGAAQRTEISATDPTFSNAVLSVGLGIDTNAVAAINALVEHGEELPIGGAAGVGALLVAIAAAVAALKRRVTSAETALAQKASASDLPYRLVEPGAWEFSGSGVQDGVEYWLEIVDGGADAEYNLYDGAMLASETRSGVNETVINFASVNITATRASLPGHLLDRAVNAVSVTGATTLTLPALVNAGKARDFLVKVTTSADDLNITWQGQGSEAPDGADELQFVTEDGDFPVVGTAGDYVFSFTEVEPHTFAVSMKPIVAAPQAQGGV